MSRSRQPWWRQRWVLVALAIAVIQCAVFWALSPPDVPGRMVPAAARHRIINETSPEFQEWLWLMTPNVFLLPSSRDFSGLAWLANNAGDVAFEPLTVKSQPLPFAPVAASIATGSLLPRVDPGPSAHWDLPSTDVPLPSVSPVPLRDRGRVRIVSGLEGWSLPPDIAVPPPPEGPAPGPTVLKIALDASGEVAAPPIVWESSGIPAADQIAVQLVTVLRLQSDTLMTPSEGMQAVAWGFLIIEWARPGPPLDPT